MAKQHSLTVSEANRRTFERALELSGEGVTPTVMAALREYVKRRGYDYNGEAAGYAVIRHIPGEITRGEITPGLIEVNTVCTTPDHNRAYQVATALAAREKVFAHSLVLVGARKVTAVYAPTEGIVARASENADRGGENTTMPETARERRKRKTHYSTWRDRAVDKATQLLGCYIAAGRVETAEELRKEIDRWEGGRE